MVLMKYRTFCKHDGEPIREVGGGQLVTTKPMVERILFKWNSWGARKSRMADLSWRYELDAIEPFDPHKHDDVRQVFEIGFA